MIRLPTFRSAQDHAARLGDVDFWWPYLAIVLERHGLLDARLQPAAGFNATHPTFLYGDVVVKLFGYSPHSWRASHAAERVAQAVVAADPTILAPALLGEGQLCDNAGPPWPYLIGRRAPGVASWRSELSWTQRRALAAELGKQVRRVHALPATMIAREADWPAPGIAEAAALSSLPPHLAAQAADYAAGLEPLERVFVHADLIENHVYVEGGRLSGIIDWGDALATDRHCELIQLYRDMFRCDKELFRAFLAAYDWPVGGDFPRRTLAMALRRQAVGLAQHNTIDVFEPIAALLPLQDIATLDELARVLFAL
jgi:hygromycin-B 7''-O-kinase